MPSGWRTSNDLRTASGGPSTTLPNFLRPLEAAVVEAVRERGIVVCFSGGNGQYSFPGQMPEVISVGGVFARDVVDNALAAYKLARSVTLRDVNALPAPRQAHARSLEAG